MGMAWPGPLKKSGSPKVLAVERDRSNVGGLGSMRGEAAGKVGQAGFEFAAENGRHAGIAELVVIEGRVEAVGAEMGARVEVAELRDQAKEELGRGVHREKKCDEVRGVYGGTRHGRTGEIS